MPNYYEVLGVSARAEDIVIDGAFRALMKRYHPDVAGQGGADLDARVKEITEAYGTLKDPVSRARYDSDLEYRARRSEGSTANTPRRPLRTVRLVFRRLRSGTPAMPSPMALWGWQQS
uniref:DnaJ domain-containing protein n=1 Tax=Phenylobacterium glaciei TaxID=2803784 RepID=A0A974P1C9_9CAUL|nr:DnaJ domain-containing protein [Phenylobacterium glaciei]